MRAQHRTQRLGFGFAQFRELRCGFHDGTVVLTQLCSLLGERLHRCCEALLGQAPGYGVDISHVIGADYAARTLCREGRYRLSAVSFGDEAQRLQ
jgi:hypothetical protein